MSERLSAQTIEAIKKGLRQERAAWPLHLRASAVAIRRFALGVGDDNPLWWSDDLDEAYAPPTFPYTGVSYGSWPTPQVITAQPTLTLWMGDHWRWQGRLRRDEAFGASCRIVDFKERLRDGEVVGLYVRERVAITGERDRPIAEFWRNTLTKARPRKAPARKRAPADGAALTPAMLAQIDRCYDEEPRRRRGAVRRRWSTVKVGDALGPMVKGPLSVTALVSFAIAWGAPLAPTNRLLRQRLKRGGGAVRNASTGYMETAEGMHWDPDIHRAFGFDRGFDFAPQRISWLSHLCTDWCGDEGMLVELEAKLLAPNFIGDVTWLSGVVARTWTADGEGFVECDLRGVNQHGALTTSARAVIKLVA